MNIDLTLHEELLSFFFFNDTATTEIYTLSLHDALPICLRTTFTSGTPSAAQIFTSIWPRFDAAAVWTSAVWFSARIDRKSTRLNSSHANISYAVFCLKKKKKSLKQNLINKF